MNTDEEELITDAHEISVQCAVMSGLEDINTFQFFTRSNMNNLRGHSLKLAPYKREYGQLMSRSLYVYTIRHFGSKRYIGVNAAKNIFTLNIIKYKLFLILNVHLLC